MLAALLAAMALITGIVRIIELRLDHPPQGEGSYEAAARILQELEALGQDRERLQKDRLPDGWYHFAYNDGSWYIAKGIDSHDEPDGGTVGVLTSNGDFGVFFTHICGRGPMPVEFSGSSAREVIENLRDQAVVYQPGTP